MNGKECWYVVDGYRPPVSEGEVKNYRGHECYMILNCNEQDAHVLIDIFTWTNPLYWEFPLRFPRKGWQISTAMMLRSWAALNWGSGRTTQCAFGVMLV